MAPVTTIDTPTAPRRTGADGPIVRDRIPRLSIVVPVFNESENLETLFVRLFQVLSAFDARSEVIMVDDGSSDDSLEIMRGLHERDPRFKIIALARNFGHQTAISAGMLYTSGEAVVLMDADLQDTPEVIEGFIRRWQQGWDVVYAVRRNRKEGVVKRAAYHLFYRILHRLARIEIPADAGDFCLMDKRVVDTLNSLPERNRFVRGLRSWVGFKQVAMPYDRAARHAGEPKYSWLKLVGLAFDGVVSFSYFPLQLGAFLGVVAALVSLVGIVVVLYFRLFTDRSVPGFASTAIIVLFTAAVQLVALGAIGEYVGRIFDEVKQRPLFVMRERIGFGD